MLQCESVIQQYQRAERKLDDSVTTISGKVDTINEHIDQVMEDAPTKLKVSVTVSDADWQKMQELHAQWLGQEEQKLVDHNQQQETIWQKQSQRLTDIVKNNEGVWISTKLFLRCRLIIPSVNHNDCNGDCFLCVFPLDSITKPIAISKIVIAA